MPTAPQNRVEAWLLAKRLQGLRAPKASGDLRWVGFFLRTQAGRLVASYFPNLQAIAPLPPWSFEPGPGGLSRGPGPCDRTLTWGGRAGGRREPGPGLRRVPRPLLPRFRGLRGQPALRLQQRLYTEWQPAGPRVVPVTRPEPREVHDERRRGHARAGGRGDGGAWQMQSIAASCVTAGDFGGDPALSAL